MGIICQRIKKSEPLKKYAPKYDSIPWVDHERYGTEVASRNLKKLLAEPVIENPSTYSVAQTLLQRPQGSNPLTRTGSCNRPKV